MAVKRCPEYEAIRAELEYNLFTGSLTRQGAKTGAYDVQNDVVRVRVLGRLYTAPRLVWMLCRGDWPPKGMAVQLINGNPWDFRMDNLRLVGLSELRTGKSARFRSERKALEEKNKQMLRDTIAWLEAQSPTA